MKRATILVLICGLLAGCGATQVSTIIRTSAIGVETLDTIGRSVVRAQAEAVRASAAYKDLRERDPQGAYRAYQAQMAPYLPLGPAMAAARASLLAAAHAADAAGRKADKDMGALLATSYALEAVAKGVEVLAATGLPVPEGIRAALTQSSAAIRGMLGQPKPPVAAPVAPPAIAPTPPVPVVEPVPPPSSPIVEVPHA